MTSCKTHRDLFLIISLSLSFLFLGPSFSFVIYKGRTLYSLSFKIVFYNIIHNNIVILRRCRQCIDSYYEGVCLFFFKVICFQNLEPFFFLHKLFLNFKNFLMNMKS